MPNPEPGFFVSIGEQLLDILARTRWELFLGDAEHLRGPWSEALRDAVQSKRMAAVLAIRAFDVLRRHQISLFPSTATTDAGDLMLTWRKGERLTLGLTLFKRGGVEWFFSDAVEGSSEGTADEPDKELPPQFHERLKQIAG